LRVRLVRRARKLLSRPSSHCEGPSRFTRREGIRLIDLVGLDRARLVRDLVLGFAIIPVSLVFIFAGTSAAGWIVYGRFQVLSRSTSVAIAVVAFAWSMQHAFMPLTFDPKFMAFRILASAPFSIAQPSPYHC
jgi:hypothetical protein